MTIAFHLIDTESRGTLQCHLCCCLLAEDGRADLPGSIRNRHAAWHERADRVAATCGCDDMARKYEHCPGCDAHIGSAKVCPICGEACS